MGFTEHINSKRTIKIKKVNEMYTEINTENSICFNCKNLENCEVIIEMLKRIFSSEFLQEKNIELNIEKCSDFQKAEKLKTKTKN